MRIFRALGGAVVAVAIVVGATGRGPAVTAQTGPQFVFVERGSPVTVADEFVVGARVSGGRPRCAISSPSALGRSGLALRPSEIVASNRAYIRVRNH